MLKIEKGNEFYNSQQKISDLTYDSINKAWFGVINNQLTEFYEDNNNLIPKREVNVLECKDAKQDANRNVLINEKYNADNNFLKFSSKLREGIIKSPSNLMVISQGNQDQFLGNMVMLEVIFIYKRYLL